MDIKNQILLSVILSLILAGGISISIVVSYVNMSDLQHQESLAADLVRGSYELSYLSNDYLVNAEPRARLQWEERYTSLQPIISQLKAGNSQEAQSLETVRDYNEKVGTLFRGIPDPGALRPGAALFPVGYQQLTWSRMNVQSQGLIYEAWRLRHMYDDDASTARFWNNILVLTLMAALLAIIGVNYLLISRRLVRSIREVNTGSEAFAAGNLKYRIPVSSDDEIGGIARRLNTMAEQIRSITASRDELNREIAERKRIEDALRESEEKYRMLFSNMLDGFAYCRMVYDSEGHPEDFIYLDVNQAFDRITGTKTVTMKRATEVYPGIKEAFPELFLIYGRVALTGMPESFEIDFKPIDKWLHISVYSPAKEYFVAVFEDITERKRAEEALRLVNKQLNLLSSITRHDILNQLMALKGYFDLSYEVIDDPKTLTEYIKKEETAARTIEAQITFTKNYQELGTVAPTWQNVNASIKKALLGLPLRAVRVEIDPKNPEVFADRLFEKVFYNLIDNALKYGGDQMKMIRASSQEIDKELLIVFEDDGVGITADDKKKLFTRGFGKNSGLGLFLSREILAITGITITENGIPGKGARFEITVPKGMWRMAGKGA